MIADAIKYAQRRKACQIHADFIHQPPELLHPTVVSWPFEAWGIDLIGLISPPSAKGHRFIIAITDYFSKQAEAVSLGEVKITNVVNFIRHYVIHLFGVPRWIIHDNGPNSQVNRSIGSAISTRFRMRLQPLITLLLMVKQKHSIRQLLSYSRNLFHQANEIGIRSSVNVFEPTELWSEPQ